MSTLVLDLGAGICVCLCFMKIGLRLDPPKVLQGASESSKVTIDSIKTMVLQRRLSVVKAVQGPPWDPLHTSRSHEDPTSVLVGPPGEAQETPRRGLRAQEEPNVHEGPAGESPGRGLRAPRRAQQEPHQALKGPPSAVPVPIYGRQLLPSTHSRRT